MGVIGVYGIVFGIVGLFFLIYGYFLYRKNQKIKARIKEAYGKKPEWKLDERDYASMKNYYLRRKSADPSIDDITFNDLNMDELFKQVKTLNPVLEMNIVITFLEDRAIQMSLILKKLFSI